MNNFKESERNTNSRKSLSKSKKSSRSISSGTNTSRTSRTSGTNASRTSRKSRGINTSRPSRKSRGTNTSRPSRKSRDAAVVRKSMKRTKGEKSKKDIAYDYNTEHTYVKLCSKCNFVDAVIYCSKCNYAVCKQCYLEASNSWTDKAAVCMKCGVDFLTVPPIKLSNQIFSEIFVPNIIRVFFTSRGWDKQCRNTLARPLKNSVGEYIEVRNRLILNKEICNIETITTFYDKRTPLELVKLYNIYLSNYHNDEGMKPKLAALQAVVEKCIELNTKLAILEQELLDPMGLRGILCNIIMYYRVINNVDQDKYVKELASFWAGWQKIKLIVNLYGTFIQAVLKKLSEPSQNTLSLIHYSLDVMRYNFMKIWLMIYGKEDLENLDQDVSLFNIDKILSKSDKIKITTEDFF